MLEALRNAFLLPELRKRILFTIFILVIYRLVAHIPVPGVNVEVLRTIQQSIEAGQAGGLGNLVSLLSLLSGGAVNNFSVLAMGVYPYVTAQLIVQLLIPVIPRLTEWSKEGDAGRRKMNRLTYFATVPMAMLNAIGQVNIFEQIGQQVTGGATRVLPNWGFVPAENILPTLVTVITMTAGTMFAIWLGELITEQGIGQGLSIIIFGGIVSRFIFNILNLPQQATDTAQGILSVVVFFAILILTIVAIVYISEGERRVNVQYGRRVRGRRMMGGVDTYVPLKVNTTGMIPLIFAQAMLVFPAVIAGFFINSPNAATQTFASEIVRFFTGSRTGSAGTVLGYAALYFLMVVAFTYFYTDVVMQQQNLAENLQKQGGFIPGIRPGRTTENFINKITRRLTLVGALFLGALAIMPYIITALSQIPGLAFLTPLGSNSSLISGAGLLIVVGVVLDTMRQLEAQLMMRRYEGFIK
ncbi:MAG TPA: preprotein translocase subunit SecY [Thermoflexales bacterium]|nr:preprotein translocase subunit SecY [Thermoflexales bacterium]HQW34370.1 preprotein translocase subunit SecY [Thermoflexales bacterium]HQZ21397.1 preprotein translocase subunit SecY [Thermoflexales bacterium]HQZ99471.1 preprotein translocase subunit SecY [Thermoflexales bacterium]